MKACSDAVARSSLGYRTAMVNWKLAEHASAAYAASSGATDGPYIDWLLLAHQSVSEFAKPA